MSARDAVAAMLAMHRREDLARNQAREATAAPDFLSPDWSGISLISVMTVREAVALSCGINRRHSWVIAHQVGEGAARAAIEKARERTEYLVAGRRMSPDEKIPLECLVDHAQRLRWDLPAGFPGAPQGATREAEPEISEPARRLAALRALGGTVKWRGGKRPTFTRSNELIAQERSEGRPRCSDKTVRDDLKAAAEAEREAMRAGASLPSPFPSGL